VTYLDGNPETDWTAAGYLAEAIPEGNPFMGTWQSMAGLPLAHGGVITHLAYRAYRRTRSPVMCTFAAGFALVTPGLLFCGASHQLLGLDLAASLLTKRLLTVAGFGLLVYSLYGHGEESGPPGGDRSPASGPTLDASTRNAAHGRLTPGRRAHAARLRSSTPGANPFAGRAQPPDMAIGDVTAADAVSPDLGYVDTGMYAVPEYGSVYVIDDERPAVVDTGIGPDVERVREALRAADVAPADLAAIVLTHVHLDHAGNAGRLARESGAVVYVHEVGAPHVIDPARLWEGTKRAVGDQIEFYDEPVAVPAEQVVELADRDTVDLGTHALTAHHAPGHAPHQVVYHAPRMDAVFTGDAAGLYVPSTDEVHVTTPPPNVDLEGAVADTETIADLAPSWLCYGHFGTARREDRLETYAETLRDWVTDVREARERLPDDEAVIEHVVETYDAPPVWGERKAAAEVALNVRGVLVALDRAG
jgi:glyoxylase-like metal-dependent hydrolase (beta-lactamase superfamily II)